MRAPKTAKIQALRLCWENAARARTLEVCAAASWRGLRERDPGPLLSLELALLLQAVAEGVDDELHVLRARVVALRCCCCCGGGGGEVILVCVEVCVSNVPAACVQKSGQKRPAALLTALNNTHTHTLHRSLGLTMIPTRHTLPALRVVFYFGGHGGRCVSGVRERGKVALQSGAPPFYQARLLT